MTNEITFYEGQTPKVFAVGKITLNKPRLHMDQTASLHYLIYVVSGTFFVSEDKQHYSVSKGQVFFRRSGHHHYSQTYMLPGTVWYWVAFSLDDTVTNDSVNLPLSKDLPMPALPKNTPIHTLPKLLTIEDTQNMFQRLETMTHLHHSSNPYKSPHLSSELMGLFYCILSAPNLYHSGNEAIVRRVDALLLEMIHSKFDANKIAAKMTLNYSYIGKCYKASTGTTINHHFNSLKIHKAIDYMQEGTRTLTQISDLLAYPNPFYFSRVFKKFKGISPKEFLKQLY